MTPCPKHLTVPATRQLSLYDRRYQIIEEKRVPPAPTLVWRGVCCDTCIEEARNLLKKNGPTHLLVIWTLKQKEIAA